MRCIGPFFPLALLLLLPRPTQNGSFPVAGGALIPPSTWNIPQPSQLSGLTSESGPGGAHPPPPFPSCDPSGFPQQPSRISVILLYKLQGVFPETANALPGRLPVLFKCLNPATLHKIGAQHKLIHSWGVPGNPMGSWLSNAHFVNSSFYITSLLKAKVQLSDLKLQGLGEPATGVPVGSQRSPPFCSVFLILKFLIFLNKGRWFSVLHVNPQMMMSCFLRPQ